MKPYFIILLLLLCSRFSSAQDKKEDFFFNEVSISANRTIEYDQNTVGQFGFGVGLDRVMFKEKRVNLTVGMGYNYLRIKMKRVDFDISSHKSYTDARYTLHNVSIPIGVRFNIGENKRFIIEGGGRIDLLFSRVRANGTSYSPFPSETHNSTDSSIIKGRGGLKNFDMGVFLGFGFRIPLNDFHSLYIKANYSYDFLSLLYNDYFILSYAKIAVGYSFGL